MFRPMLVGRSETPMTAMLLRHYCITIAIQAPQGVEYLVHQLSSKGNSRSGEVMLFCSPSRSDFW
jgi:hypothetical protein